jgi:DNA-binding transcriptional regulator YhcF (GntR family)
MIVRGVLRDGDRMPSVRELAGFADVNVNTARAAYESLEREGLISTEHGRGTFVQGGSERPGVEEILTGAIEAAAREGLDPRALAALIWSAGDAGRAGVLPDPPLPPLDPTAGAAELRRELMAQIARIETQLGAYAWDDPAQPPPPRVETAVPVGRLPTVAELGRTRDELIERLARLRDRAERRGASQQRAREHVETMREDPGSHRWEIVSAADAGSPGASWRVVPRFGPLGAILGWWRVKAEPE